MNHANPNTPHHGVAGRRVRHVQHVHRVRHDGAAHDFHVGIGFQLLVVAGAVRHRDRGVAPDERGVAVDDVQ